MLEQKEWKKNYLVVKKKNMVFEIIIVKFILFFNKFLMLLKQKQDIQNLFEYVHKFKKENKSIYDNI